MRLNVPGLFYWAFYAPMYILAFMIIALCLAVMGGIVAISFLVLPPHHFDKFFRRTVRKPKRRPI